MRITAVKLIIPEFGIDEWIHLENGNKATLRYILEKYVMSKPITIATGLAFSARSGYLYSMKYNSSSGIITRTETASRLIGGMYITFLWRCLYTNKAGTKYSGIYTRPGVFIDAKINFKAGDKLSLSLSTIITGVSI